MANRVQGEATILESTYDPAARSRDGVDTQRDDGPVGLLADKIAGLPYEFLLEVRVPGSSDARVTWRGRVPDKAEKLGFFDHIRIPVSLVVPVSLDPTQPDRVEIDWKAFLALPDRVARMKEASRRSTAAAVGATPAPTGMDEQDGATRLMVFRLAKQVQEGSLSRDQFAVMCQQLMQVSQLAHADYLAAVEVAEGR